MTDPTITPAREERAEREYDGALFDAGGYRLR